MRSYFTKGNGLIQYSLYETYNTEVILASKIDQLFIPIGMISEYILQVLSRDLYRIFYLAQILVVAATFLFYSLLRTG